MEPLGHSIDLDNPDDVDWLVKYAQEAKKVIKMLEKEVADLHKLVEISRRIAEDYKEKWHRAIDAWEKTHNELVDAREKIVRLEERLAIREKGIL